MLLSAAYNPPSSQPNPHTRDLSVFRLNLQPLVEPYSRQAITMTSEVILKESHGRSRGPLDLSAAEVRSI